MVKRRGRGPLLLLTLIAGAVAAVLAAPLRRLTRPRSAGVDQTTRTQRNVELANLGTKLATRQAALKARKVFASAERKEALDREAMLKSAEDVASTLGGMKGLMMKIGQMQSYIHENLPEEWTAALSQLQADAPPMSGELAASVIEAELGRPPSALFAEWDPVPIAAASIGQVHRALTHDDRAVAVKVQYPGADQALTADLDNMQMLVRLGQKAAAKGDTEAAPEIDVDALVEEFRTRILDEVDYRTEAASQRRFAEHYAGHPFVHVPPVLDELSGQRVLTTELAEGMRFAEAETWSQEQRDQAGEAIFRFAYGNIFRLGFFNGDPHPGNYLFRPGGQVTFLDFGLAKHLDERMTALVNEIVKASELDRDPAAFRRTMEELGFLKPGAPISDQAVFDAMAKPWDVMTVDEPVKMPFPDFKGQQDPAAASKELAKAIDMNPAFVILPRSIIGTQAVIARLGARANWRRIAREIWPFAQEPPSTDLGRLEAAWLASRS